MCRFTPSGVGICRRLGVLEEADDGRDPLSSILPLTAEVRERAGEMADGAGSRGWSSFWMLCSHINKPRYDVSKHIL